MLVDGKKVSVDLWKNSLNSESANMTTSSVPSAPTEDELPF
jgi:hypothetical protein